MNVCGLSRLHCRRCQQETLHKNGATCVHCGTRFEVSVPPNLSRAELRAQIDSRNYQIQQARKRKRLSIKP